MSALIQFTDRLLQTLPWGHDAERYLAEAGDRFELERRLEQMQRAAAGSWSGSTLG